MHCAMSLYELQALHCERRPVSSRAGAPPAEVKSGSCGTAHACLLSVPASLIQEDVFCLCAPKLRHKSSRGAFLFCLCLRHRQLSSRLDMWVELFRVQRITSFSLSSVPDPVLLLLSHLIDNSTPPQTLQLTWLGEVPLLKLIKKWKVLRRP